MNDTRPATAAESHPDRGGLPVEISVPVEVALTEAVSDVVGVTDVFAPTLAVTELPQIVTALIAGEPDQVNRVRVKTSAAGTQIDTRIGVDRSGNASETARDVAAALLAVADADTTVSVQVSRIA